VPHFIFIFYFFNIHPLVPSPFLPPFHAPPALLDTDPPPSLASLAMLCTAFFRHGWRAAASGV
jgi:hypothetical protein